tara:strand:- start:1152 stop:1868 length:717 start_codon:yes stop_codon:yes gene_type:complete
MVKKIIIIPTLNEEKNVTILYKKIKKNLKKFHVLFVDDNSNDRTQFEIKYLKKKYKNVTYIFRKKRLGVGSAHKVGLIYSYKNKYDVAITMDADGTHDPKYIKKMLILSNNYDLVMTNRFLLKNSLRDWTLFRKFLTKLRYHTINLALGISYDSSGALRCYNLNKIKKKHILLAKNNGYSFFWESTFLLEKKLYKIFEIPIKLPFRIIGSSKMRYKDIFFALIYLALYFFKKNLGNIK